MLEAVDEVEREHDAQDVHGGVHVPLVMEERTVQGVDAEEVLAPVDAEVDARGMERAGGGEREQPLHDQEHPAGEVEIVRGGLNTGAHGREETAPPDHLERHSNTAGWTATNGPCCSRSGCGCFGSTPPPHRNLGRLEPKWLRASSAYFTTE